MLLLFALFLNQMNPLCDMLLDYSSLEENVTVTVINNDRDKLNGWLTARYKNTTIRKHIDVNKTQRFEFPAQNKISFQLNSQTCSIKRNFESGNAKVNMNKKAGMGNGQIIKLVADGRREIIYDRLKNDEGLILLVLASVCVSLIVLWKS